MLRPFASLRATCGARLRRGLAQTRFAQTSAIPDPPTSALLGPARTGQSGPGAGTKDRNTKKIKKTNTNKDSPWRVLVSFGIRGLVFGCSVFGLPVSTPFWMRRGAQGQTDQGSRCLSEASLARPRLDRAPQVARSEAEGRSNQGRLFFCLLFFWRSKRKVSCRRATPGQQSWRRAGARKPEARPRLRWPLNPE